jgi:hypothetical protein
MKTLIATAAFVVALVPFAPSFAAQDQAAIEDCFKKHGQLMDKPALRNPRDCWQTHRHMMQAS